MLKVLHFIREEKYYGQVLQCNNHKSFVQWRTSEEASWKYFGNISWRYFWQRGNSVSVPLSSSLACKMSKKDYFWKLGDCSQIYFVKNRLRFSFVLQDCWVNWYAWSKPLQKMWVWWVEIHRSKRTVGVWGNNNITQIKCGVILLR